MKNSTKILIGVIVVALVGGGVYLGGGNLFKGSLGDLSRQSFIVSLSSTPVSETVLPGQDVKMIGLTLKNGTAKDVVLSKATVRVNADDDAKFDYVGYGDTPANTIVGAVSLYKVNSDNTETQISGSVGLTVSGTINQAKYYAAVFQNLNYTIPKSSTGKWLVKAKLLNNVTKTFYVAADLMPDLDIQATTIVQNGSGLKGNGVNGLLKKDVPTVFKTVAVKGSLGVSEYGSPDAGIIVAGKVDAEFAKYKFTATNEAFIIKNLDVVIDSDSNFADNPADDSGSNNIIKATLAYPKKDGTSEKASAVLQNGVAKFTNLNFYVPPNTSVPLIVLANINLIEFGAISGAQVRLGLSEYTENSFEAIGENSGATIKFSDIPATTNSATVKSMIIRKTIPTVAKLPTASSKLNNGINDIVAITASANEKESVALKKLTFNIYYNSNLEISALALYRKIGSGVESNITSNVSIKNSTGSDLKSGGVKLTGGWQDTIYVTWDKLASDEEFISKGVTNTYILRATVNGAQANNSISTYMPDEKAPTVTDTAMNLLTSKYNFIWSDNSAVNHSTLTQDWTTGYLVPTFPSATLSLTY